MSKDDIAKPAGPVDVLIGCEYAAYHPQRTQNVGHLLLLQNRFGLCIGGTHPSIKDEIKKHDLSYARVQHVIKVEDFYKIENLGVECVPRCGSCKCGHCAVGSKYYSIKEEKELELIEKNMKFDAKDNRWLAEYPWIKDPADLPDNRRVALAMLYSTERMSVDWERIQNMQLYTITKFEIWYNEGSLVNSPKRNLTITKVPSITFRTTRCSNQTLNLLPLE